jgi:hypothetical protein
MLITVDVESLYTNIPIQEAIEIISITIRGHAWKEFIVQGLRILMMNNFFAFGDTCWLQQHGTAMGTATAPAFASLYLAFFEDQVVAQFETHIRYYKRYIDDIFIVWQNKDTPFSFKHFIAKFKWLSKLNFTYAMDDQQVAFLDLWVIKTQTLYTTRTHQKQLNLYLYLPANSAHPPGALKGLIFGLIKKYRFQNPSNQDFKAIAQLLFNRLLDRGYRPSTLQPIFRTAMQTNMQCQATSANTQTRTTIFKIPYDPNGPTKQEVRRLLETTTLLNVLKPFGIDKIVVCYCNKVKM